MEGTVADVVVGDRNLSPEVAIRGRWEAVAAVEEEIAPHLLPIHNVVLKKEVRGLDHQVHQPTAAHALPTPTAPGKGSTLWEGARRRMEESF